MATDLPIEELGLSTRTTNTLLRAGIRLSSEIPRTKLELLRIPDLGRRGVESIERCLGVLDDRTSAYEAMLAALRAALPTLEERERQLGVESEPLRMMRAAIAKAEGR